MCTIPSQSPAPLASAPSAYGGLLPLRQAWQALAGDALVQHGIHWRGRAGALLLFVLVALPILGCTSVRAVATCCGRVRDPLWAALGWAEVASQRRLARFVSSERHDWAMVQAAMVAQLARHPATAVAADGEAILAVDSTVVEKRFGPHLPGVHPVYDAVRRRLVDGWEIVSGCVVGPTGAWPLGLVPHRPSPAGATGRRRRKAQAGEAPSKLDLALQLIATAVQAAVGAPTVVGDGAYAVNWWLREVAALALHWLVATRHDRRLRIGAEVRAFAAWVERLPAVWGCVEALPGGGGIYGGLLPEATVLDKGRRQQGLACRPAYFERRDRHGRVGHRWYLVTSQLTWSPEQVWAHWQRRWAIEGFHRDAKQGLQFAAMHGRHWAGLVAWLACCSLRASLLALLRAADPAWGALSTDAVVQALRHAACLVTPQAVPTPRVSPPPTLPPLPRTLPTLPAASAEWPITYAEAA